MVDSELPDKDELEKIDRELTRIGQKLRQNTLSSAEKDRVILLELESKYTSARHLFITLYQEGLEPDIAQECEVFFDWFSKKLLQLQQHLENQQSFETFNLSELLIRFYRFWELLNALKERIDIDLSLDHQG